MHKNIKIWTAQLLGMGRVRKTQLEGDECFCLEDVASILGSIDIPYPVYVCTLSNKEKISFLPTKMMLILFIHNLNKDCIFVEPIMRMAQAYNCRDYEQAVEWVKLCGQAHTLDYDLDNLLSMERVGIGREKYSLIKRFPAISSRD